MQFNRYSRGFSSRANTSKSTVIAMVQERVLSVSPTFLDTPGKRLLQPLVLIVIHQFSVSSIPCHPLFCKLLIHQVLTRPFFSAHRHNIVHILTFVQPPQNNFSSPPYFVRQYVYRCLLASQESGFAVSYLLQLRARQYILIAWHADGFFIQVTHFAEALVDNQWCTWKPQHSTNEFHITVH